MWGGSTHNLGSGSRLLQGWSASPVPRCPHHQSKAHLHCPCEFTPFSDEQGAGSVLLFPCPQGQVSPTYTFCGRSTVWSRHGIGATLWNAVANEGQGQLTHTYDHKGALPPASGIDRWWGRVSLPCLGYQ